LQTGDHDYEVAWMGSQQSDSKYVYRKLHELGFNFDRRPNPNVNESIAQLDECFEY
jgi:transposase